MYIPKHYEVTDFDEIKSFIENNPFGTIVTVREGKPTATHFPFEITAIDDEYYITGHLAYKNPQWRTLEDNDKVLVMFQGPHSYVSASWYETEEVPTWNYQSVHVYGTSQILTEEELKADLIEMLKRYEQHRENPVIWESLSEKNKNQIKGIVGFKVKIEEIQAAYKLSQNKSDEDYHNIIDHLSGEYMEGSQKIAEEMTRINTERD